MRRREASSGGDSGRPWRLRWYAIRCSKVGVARGADFLAGLVGDHGFAGEDGAGAGEFAAVGGEAYEGEGREEDERA